MLTFLIIAVNVIVMGFLGLCVIWDQGEFEKLGPRQLIMFFIAVWVLGCMTGAL